MNVRAAPAAPPARVRTGTARAAADRAARPIAAPPYRNRVATA
jgi:hypothetical protein